MGWDGHRRGRRPLLALAGVVPDIVHTDRCFTSVHHLIEQIFAEHISASDTAKSWKGSNNESDAVAALRPSQLSGYEWGPGGGCT